MVVTVVVASVGSVGLLSIAEAVWSYVGWDDTAMHAVRLPVTLGFAAAMAVAFVFLNVRLAWRSRRQAADSQVLDDISAATSFCVGRSTGLHLIHSADYRVVQGLEAALPSLGLTLEESQSVVEAAAYLTCSPTNIDKNEGEIPPPSLRARQTAALSSSDKWHTVLNQAHRFANISCIAVLVAPLQGIPEEQRTSTHRWHHAAADVLTGKLAEHGYTVARTSSAVANGTVVSRREIADMPLTEVRDRLATAIMFISDVALGMYPSRDADRHLLAELSEWLGRGRLSAYQRQVTLETMRQILYTRNNILSNTTASTWREYATCAPEQAAAEDTQIALTMGQYVAQGTYFLADVGRVGVQVLTPGAIRSPGRSWKAAKALTQFLHDHDEPCAPSSRETPSLVARMRADHTERRPLHHLHDVK